MLRCPYLGNPFYLDHSPEIRANYAKNEKEECQPGLIVLFGKGPRSDKSWADKRAVQSLENFMAEDISNKWRIHRMPIWNGKDKRGEGDCPRRRTSVPLRYREQRTMGDE